MSTQALLSCAEQVALFQTLNSNNAQGLLEFPFLNLFNTQLVLSA